MISQWVDRRRNKTHGTDRPPRKNMCKSPPKTVPHHVPPAQQLCRAVFPVMWPRRIICVYFRFFLGYGYMGWMNGVCAHMCVYVPFPPLPHNTPSHQPTNRARSLVYLHAAVLGLGVEQGDPGRHLQRVRRLRVQVGGVCALRCWYYFMWINIQLRVDEPSRANRDGMQGQSIDHIDRENVTYLGARARRRSRPAGPSRAGSTLLFLFV